MKNTLLTLACLLLFMCLGLTQQLIELAPMPETVSNNAVCHAIVDGEDFVYSFSGIDETKEFSGIHKRAFKYSVLEDTWEIISDLPSGNGRIAAGASFVDGKIYIIGGYEVFSDGTERSFDEVHIYDPKNDSYLDNGSPVPIPIDDHVQAVWKDSLIFVVTGWSQEENVPAVQIYNPSLDIWTMGTDTPDNGNYKAFGASGLILGDTIYYAGGAKSAGGGFASANNFRKGYINPDEPTQITWETSFALSSIGYRMAAAHFKNSKPVWIGGSGVPYNYNGIGYNTGTGVDPVNRILEYSPSNGKLTVNPFEIEIMDLRGAAQLSDQSVIVCGGMTLNQQVSDKTYLLDIGLVSNSNLAQTKVKIQPNPSYGKVNIYAEGIKSIRLLDMAGTPLINELKWMADELDLSNINAGMYFVELNFDNNSTIVEKIIIQK